MEPYSLNGSFMGVVILERETYEKMISEIILFREEEK
jgi:hypothetical protein